MNLKPRHGVSAFCFVVLVLAAFYPSVLFAANEPDAAPKSIPIGQAYAADAVNASVFRNSSVVTAKGHQFVTYYDANGSVVVARRDLPDGKWDIAVQSFKGNIKDAHNDTVIGVSGDGVLHLSYDHHNNRLHYRTSAKPYDIHSFGDETAMTGQHEASVSYPEFISAPDGTLYFFYRDGASGNGNTLMNRYDVATKTWSAVQHPLLDGEGQCNPYLWRPSIGPDNSIQLGWCWRDSPNAESNHDICYARSNDGGRTWVRSDGKPQAVPITRANAEVAVPVPQGSNLINQCSSAVDPENHPHLLQYYNDTAGVPQYFDVWFDGTKWIQQQVSHRTAKFSLNGGGSLAIPLSRPEVAVSRSGTVCVISRDAELGGGVTLYTSSKPFQEWKRITVTHEDLGNWEPTYDLTGVRESGMLSVFVLPVQQGNHEHTTAFPPQTASVLELPLP